MPRPTLDPLETRALGALVEKALATPEGYPLTTQALKTACNQKSGREPVTDYAEHEVSDAVQRLIRRSLAGTTSGSGHRTVKYRHTLDRALGLGARELAVLATLMLRGPQTPGELRTRTARLFAFQSVPDVEEALWLLAERDEPLAYKIPRGPGQAADRYAHGLAGEPDLEALAESVRQAPDRAGEGGGPAAEALAARVEALEGEVAALREAFQSFRASFE